MRFILAILIVFFSSNCFAFWTKGTDTAPEVQTFCKRVLDDGGTVIDIEYMDKTVKLLKQLGIWSNVKFLGDANMGVQLDASGVSVQKLYDLSGNNNDAVQATVGNQPVWTAGVQNGKAVLVFNGTSHFLGIAGSPVLNTRSLSLIAAYKKTVAGDGGAALRILLATTSVQYLVVNGSTVDGYTAADDYVYFDEHLGLKIPNNQVSAMVLLALTSNASPSASTYKNGSLSTTSTLVVAGDRTGLFIGALNNTPLYPFPGNMSTIVFFNAALTTAQRTAIETFLNSYYSIY